MSAQIAAFI